MIANRRPARTGQWTAVAVFRILRAFPTPADPMTLDLFRCRPALAAALLSLAFQALASPPPDTVQASTVVADRSAAARSEGVGRALADALQRLTPSPERIVELDLTPLLADDMVLQRFSYEQVSRPTASGIPSIRLLLHAWFDTAALRGFLVRTGLPVWRGGQVRPVLWLAMDDEAGPRLVDAGRDPVAAELLTRLAARGVVPVAPLGDLEDLRLIEALAGDGLEDALRGARRRYPDGPLVLAWIRPDLDGGSVDWWVVDLADTERFASSGPSPAIALAEGGARLVGVLAGQHAVRASDVLPLAREVERGPGDYVIWIEGLERAGAWAAANALLSSQTMVAGVFPEVAAAERARVRVTLDTPLADLLSLLVADGRLRVIEGPVADADLRLRWQD
ncbi:MAG: DUF2066 domain-containing protein [Xanthomonadales bacterium]|nr:DUF2066 domain-containing protein [Xanthomonadales bacterium]